MNVAAKKTSTQDYFDVTLEDAKPFKASVTGLRSSISPNRGRTWVVEATEKDSDEKRLRVFLIVFSQTLSNGSHPVGEDKQGFVTIELVDYTDPQDLTSQLAESGNIDFQLDVAGSHFSGDFNAKIEKKEVKTVSTVADGKFDTLLTSTNR
ncbi:hypothetical protein [Pseudomonas sp. H3(2019)]|uniref:hypothetical protein n=1 Tax=Pseudomonas sp. H3(2019) TaxID=2598724 RepID=UPI001191A21D|nr:hypothetical protein [Pseudomonas sp. H3(2019)]TVT80335.1 hypothetical protein FPT12_23320 [Pseudomonas sp. H3(2019)]